MKLRAWLGVLLTPCRAQAQATGSASAGVSAVRMLIARARECVRYKGNDKVQLEMFIAAVQQERASRGLECATGVRVMDSRVHSERGVGHSGVGSGVMLPQTATYLLRCIDGTVDLAFASSVRSSGFVAASRARTDRPTLLA